MAKPTDRAAPAYTPEQVDELIDQARLATGLLPPAEHRADLHRQLRAAIGQLAEDVRQQQRMLPERSRAWYRCDKLLATTDELLAEELSAAPLAAALHVAAMGRHCQGLADCIRGAR